MNKNKRASIHRKAVAQVLEEFATLEVSNVERRRYMRDKYKTLRGCEDCGYNVHSCALQLDHLDPDTKFISKSGKRVDPSNMVYQNTTKMFEEYLKCRVLCSNCHAIHTHTVQRQPRMSVDDVRLVA